MTGTPGQDPFEKQIKEALGAEAAEPAPERLVARVSAVSRTAASPSGRFARLVGRGSGLTQPGIVVAAVIVLAVAAVTLRGGPASGPGASNPAASNPAPSNPAASSGPTAGGSPTPSAASPGPTSAASPAPSWTATMPAGGAIPSGFVPGSVTFVSPSEGWVLGSATCAGQSCAAILRTTDGGRTWVPIAGPQDGQVPVPFGQAGVRTLRFADPLDGWAFGLGAWATHDGGTSWTRLALPAAAADTQVWTLETSGGLVHAAYFDPAVAGVRIATSPIGKDDWTLSPEVVPVGAGPVPQAQLALHGKVGWLVEVDRTVVGGAELTGGAWGAWTPPCLDAYGPATLAASSDTALVAACDVGVWSTPAGVHLYRSADGGATFTEAAAKVPVATVQGLAATAKAIVVGGYTSGGAALVESVDGGRTWARVYETNGAWGFSDLGFTTADQGVAVASDGAGHGQLLMTRDGGRTWVPVALTGP